MELVGDDERRDEGGVAGMNRDTPSSAVTLLELRKRSFARANPAEMHKAHWRPTVATVKITEFSTDRPRT